MTVETAPATSEKMLAARDLRRVYWRSTFLLGSFNFERVQTMDFCYTLMPTIRKFYRGDKSAQATAFKRHPEFYNTHPWVSSVAFGVTVAMEEQKARSEEIPEETITLIKAGLMGPSAGISDPIFWGTAHPVLAALGASLALNDSIVGPLLFPVGTNLLHMLTRWYSLKSGCERGAKVITEVGGGQLKEITQMAAIIGLFVMGTLILKQTTIKSLTVVSKVADLDTQIVEVAAVQSILDQLPPDLTALGLTFLCV